MVKSSVEHKVKAGETIMDLAEKYGMTWKGLAKLNNLKAPYDLKVGSIVLIPKPQQKPKKK
jgi:LysM repeat protein